MKSVLAPVLAILVFGAPAAAQKMGGANRGAPLMSHSIAFGDASLAVTHHAITWASGETMKMLMTKGDGGARMRSRVNRSAEGSPLGSVTTSTPFTVGGKTVPAGKHKLYFNIDEDCCWHLIVHGDDAEPVKWKLPLKDSGHQSSRLSILVMAGEKNGTGILRIAFGKQSCMVDLSPAKKDGQ